MSNASRSASLCRLIDLRRRRERVREGGDQDAPGRAVRLLPEGKSARVRAVSVASVEAASPVGGSGQLGEAPPDHLAIIEA